MTSRLVHGVSAAALLATLALAGCGSSDDNTEAFVGIWAYTTGTETITCGAAPSTDPLKGNITIGHGVDAPLVMVFDPCTAGLKLNVSGTSANVIGGQMCTGMSSTTDNAGNVVPVSITFIFNAGAFNLTGTTATVTAGGTANAIVSGSTIPCTFTQTGTVTKVSK
jgi:hypothetical protein